MPNVRVFVPVPRGSKWNLESLLAHGTALHILEKTRISPMNADEVLLQVDRELVANHFDPDRDRLVLTGPSIAVSCAFGAALARYRRVRVLLFDARENRYIERTLRADQSVTLG